MQYRDRHEAGRELARELQHYAGCADAIVLALPRGGVPVGFEVADTLGLPLDVFVVRKLGVPGNEELALGAIASGDVRFLNEEIARMFPDDLIDAVAARERDELQRRERSYRSDRPFSSLHGRTVILVDDGLATGATMHAAAAAARQQNPARIVVAVPVAAQESLRGFDPSIVEVVCLHTPAGFHSVGQWYADFSQTTDEEVRNLLAQAARRTQ